MTPLMTVFAARTVLKATLVVGALAITSFQANALSLRVKLACATDYYAHCTAHSPDSPETRSCMRAVGSGLSRSCVDALVSAGEVSAEEVARRRAANKTASR